MRRCGCLAEAEQCAREVVQLLAAPPEWDDVDRINAEWFLAHTLEDAGRADEAVASLRAFVASVRGQGRTLTEIISLQILAGMILSQAGSDAVEAESLLCMCQYLR